MSALGPIASRLDPLIRRLASGSDGERLACVHAIDRTLRKANASWHDLADRLANPAKGATPIAETRRGGPRFTDPTAAAEWLLAEHFEGLTGREAAFVATMARARWRPSPKQGGWLAALVERHGGKMTKD